MGPRNLHRSLSPLHAELEALIWVMHCLTFHQKTDVAFHTDCTELVKMVSAPKEWPAFAVLFGEFALSKEVFPSFSLSFIPRR